MTLADLQPPLSNSGFSFMLLSTSENQDELTKMNTDKSAGLHPIFLKAAARIMAAAIRVHPVYKWRLLNMSLQISEFPSDWK